MHTNGTGISPNPRLIETTMPTSAKGLMVFDWDKAAQLIAERQPSVASAGLSGDWINTGGTFWRDSAPVPADEFCAHLASTKATPEIDLDGISIPCFILKSVKPEWGSATYWPESALAIITHRRTIPVKQIPE